LIAFHRSPNDPLSQLRPASIEMFAGRQHLKLCCDAEDGTLIVPGKVGHIFIYNETLLGVMFMPRRQISTMPPPHRPRLWAAAKRQAIGLGMILRQGGDAEGTLSFDPEDPGQCRLAIRIAGIKRLRQLSPERRAKLRADGRCTQFSSKATGASGRVQHVGSMIVPEEASQIHPVQNTSQRRPS